MINYFFEHTLINNHVSLRTKPEVRCIDFFFNALSKEFYYQEVNDILARKGIKSQVTSIYFPEWLDEGMIADGMGFSDDEIEISDIFNGRYILKEKEFSQILYDYGQAIIKYKINDFSKIPGWESKMRCALNLLEDKIKRMP